MQAPNESAASGTDAVTADGPTTGAKHDAELIVRELNSQQATRSRHICVLMGAGTSRAAGIPTLTELGEIVREALAAEFVAAVPELWEGRNLEEVLTRVRTLVTVLGPDQTLDQLNAEDARRVESAITDSIISVVTGTTTDPNVFRGFAAWAAQQDRDFPLEVFTLNYDLLLEAALETFGAAYFDGFIGNIRGRFRGDLVDADDPLIRLPPHFVRLWKLHGSVNWLVESADDQREVIRIGTPASSGSVAAIYPSDDKYSDSRRLPFLALHDRLRRALSQKESMLLITGYSFGDQHLNEVIFDAALRNPRSQFVAFCRDDIPTVLSDRAAVTPNLFVTAKSEAIVGGQRGAWFGNDIPGVFESGEWLLGDFRRLSQFFAVMAGGPRNDKPE